VRLVSGKIPVKNAEEVEVRTLRDALIELPYKLPGVLQHVEENLMTPDGEKSTVVAVVDAKRAVVVATLEVTLAATPVATRVVTLAAPLGAAAAVDPKPHSRKSSKLMLGLSKAP